MSLSITTQKINRISTPIPVPSHYEHIRCPAPLKSPIIEISVKGTKFNRLNLLNMDNIEFNSFYNTYNRTICDYTTQLNMLHGINFMYNISLERRVMSMEKYVLTNELDKYFISDIKNIIASYI